MRNNLKNINTGNYISISPNDVLKNDQIRVYLLENRIDIYNEIARVMANKVKSNNEKNIITSFILPVGPRGQYRRFAAICNMERISCKNLITINMDDYLDKNYHLIPENNPLSFRGYMKSNLFDLLQDNLKIKPENIYFPNPANTSEIINVLNDIGGVDICFGGVGINGHVAFNEPISNETITEDEFRNLKTRVLDISNETILINSLKYGGNIEYMPQSCITIGFKEIFMSKELRFYLEHNWQSAVIRRIIFEKPTPSFPATFLKEHNKSSITLSENVLISYAL